MSSKLLLPMNSCNEFSITQSTLWSNSVLTINHRQFYIMTSKYALRYRGTFNSLSWNVQVPKLYSESRNPSTIILSHVSSVSLQNWNTQRSKINYRVFYLSAVHHDFPVLTLITENYSKCYHKMSTIQNVFNPLTPLGCCQNDCELPPPWSSDRPRCASLPNANVRLRLCVKTHSKPY